MTVAQIMQAIDCTEDQARGLVAHIAPAPKVEQGTWTHAQRTIKRCEECATRQWHDGDACVVCRSNRDAA